MPDAVRIAMFSGPRNISTTLMRSFEKRPDTVVLDEPFYACYLNRSGAPHPMRNAILAAQPTEWTAVIEQIKAPLPVGASISFQKHIAFHFMGDAPLEWTKDARLFILIRDPRAMVASYKNKYDDVAPITDSFNIQRRIYDDCLARGKPCPIVDASDMLLQPEAVLHALCNALDIPFTDEMLAWPAGRRTSDGVWAPHWYDAVEASTGFRPHRQPDIVLPLDLEAIANACRPNYEFFYRNRLTA